MLHQENGPYEYKFTVYHNIMEWIEMNGYYLLKTGSRSISIEGDPLQPFLTAEQPLIFSSSSQNLDAYQWYFIVVWQFLPVQAYA